MRDSNTNGWLEAAVAWEVCASIHRTYAKRKDAFFTTRQNDFINHAINSRKKANNFKDIEGKKSESILIKEIEYKD